MEVEFTGGVMTKLTGMLRKSQELWVEESGRESLIHKTDGPF